VLSSSTTAFYAPNPHPTTTRHFPPSSASSYHHLSTNNQPTTTTTTRLLSTQTDPSTTTETKPKIPITLLAGFLGSGKTSALQNLLSNNDGVKIGIIVNDVASVNIDQKLIANPNQNTNALDENDTIELQNGCACCSLADELLTSVEQLTANGKRPLDAIVVELSGVADPATVRENWSVASDMSHPATNLASMGQTVTLVDSTTFGSDWMTYDSFGDREGWVDEGDDCAAERKVPELLAEQVECADVLLINKVDLAVGEEVKTARGVARSLNEKASVFECEFGNVSVGKILGEGFGKKEVVEEKSDCCSDPGCVEPDCAGDPVPASSTCADADCGDPDCADHGTAATTSTCQDAACGDPDCADHGTTATTSTCQDADCGDPDCADHGTTATTSTCQDADCGDPDCADHGTDAKPKKDVSLAALQITNFVYKSPIPFYPPRLMALLNSWPVPIKETLDLDALAEAATEGYDVDDAEKVAVKSPFTGVIRSKGFCWMAPGVWGGGSGDDSWRHDTAMFWSHAGKHFGISTAGKWWGTVSKEQMKSFFPTNMKEYERILNEDWASEEFGDRRQELVFIGVKIEEDKIRSALNDCLCNDEEMAEYRKQLKNMADTTFAATAVDMDGNGGGPSLFDVGGYDNMDSDVNIKGD